MGCGVRVRVRVSVRGPCNCGESGETWGQQLGLRGQVAVSTTMSRSAIQPIRDVISAKSNDNVCHKPRETSMVQPDCWLFLMRSHDDHCVLQRMCFEVEESETNDRPR